MHKDMSKSALFKKMQEALNNNSIVMLKNQLDKTDPAIAIMDAWATVLHIINFYSERYAEENYLLKATEVFSAIELAYLVGYKPAPGLAAETHLALTVAEEGNTAEPLVIKKGLQIQSVPRQDELPQIFETSEDCIASPKLNILLPYITKVEEQNLKFQNDDGNINTELQLQGKLNNLQIGDKIVAQYNKTKLLLLTVYKVQSSMEGFTTVKASVQSNQNIQFDDKKEIIINNVQVFAMRKRVASFGNNAPDYNILNSMQKGTYKDWNKSEQTVFRTSQNEHFPEGIDLYLDQQLTNLEIGSWIVLTTNNDYEIYKLKSVQIVSANDYALSGQVTGIGLFSPPNSELKPKEKKFGFRITSILVQSEQLTLYSGNKKSVKNYSKETNEITLDGVYNGLLEGKKLIISQQDEYKSEVIVLKKKPALDSQGNTVLTLTHALMNNYRVEKSIIYGNVVAATHGESVEEILGSGDYAKPNQQFKLTKKPLTYLPGNTENGFIGTLKIWVNDILWQEVDNFYNARANSCCYTISHTDDWETIVQFGDGVNGARLPTGEENVKAYYRIGSGLSGAVDINSLTLLNTRPLGLNEVTNPVGAIGAASPDTVEQIKKKAFLPVITAKRLVSLTDFESFLQGYPGITKVKINTFKQISGVYITLALEDEKAKLDTSSKYYQNMKNTLEKYAISGTKIVIATCESDYFSVKKATIIIHKNYINSNVLESAKKHLLKTFGFDAREFMQAVRSSDIIQALHQVSGVVAVENVEYINKKPKEAAWDGKFVPAGLLIINPVINLDKIEI